jgi:hypothetical protein
VMKAIIVFAEGSGEENSFARVFRAFIISLLRASRSLLYQWIGTSILCFYDSTFSVFCQVV